MRLVLIAVLIGVIAGWLRGGDLLRIATVRVRGWPLLVLAVGALLLVEWFDPDQPAPLVACAVAALVVVAVRNAHLVGVPIVVLGMLANLAVLVVNGGMPVDADALVSVGLAERDELASISLAGARHVATPDDHLRFLGDIVPVRGFREVVSFGDLVVLVGVADVVSNLMCRRRRARPLPRNAEPALLSIAPPIPAPDGLAVDLRPAAQTSTANPAQHWGTAPSPAAVSGSQYSANPLRAAPARKARASSGASGAPRRAAATHSR